MFQFILFCPANDSTPRYRAANELPSGEMFQGGRILWTQTPAEYIEVMEYFRTLHLFSLPYASFLTYPIKTPSASIIKMGKKKSRVDTLSARLALVMKSGKSKNVLKDHDAPASATNEYQFTWAPNRASNVFGPETLSFSSWQPTVLRLSKPK